MTPAPDVRKARVGVSIGFLIGGMTLATWAVHIPLVAARLALDPGILGLAILCIGIGAFVSQPVVGKLIGRFGSHRTATVLLPAFIVLMPAVIAAPTRPLLFVACLLIGSAGGSYNVAINTQGAEVERACGRPTMSSFHGFWSLGGLAGATLGGVIIAAGWGNGSGAAVLAAVMIVAGLAASRLFLPSPPQSPAPRRPKTRRFVVPGAALAGIIAIAILGEYIEGSVNNWSTLYLSTVRGLAPGRAASGLAMFSFAMAVCRLAGGSVVARLGERTIVLGGGLLMALGFAIVIFVPWPAVSPFGFAVVALGAANCVPVLIGVASRIPGIEPGVGVATVVTALTVGFLSSPPIVGFITQAFGASIGLGVLGLAAAAIALVAAFRQWQPAPAAV